jgi:hypothetical protein
MRKIDDRLYLLALLVSIAALPAQAAEVPVPAEVAALKGKLVRVWHDVDLTGTGKPSPLHTGYLMIVLKEAGAVVDRGNAFDDPFNVRKADVVIFGEMMPPPKLSGDEARDPFMVRKVKEMEEAIAKYREARPKLATDAAAAGARVIQFADVPAALGMHVTEAQMIEALNAETRKLLEKPLPQVKFDAIGLVDVIDFLRDVTGANIFVNWRALEAAGVDRNTPITLDLSDSPLSGVLDQLLTQAGGKTAKLAYDVREGVITISSDADIKKGNR